MAKRYLSRKGIAILSVIFGILVIVLPSLLSWVIGLFLIITGILQLLEE